MPALPFAVRVEVPGVLAYRDVVLRTVSAVCKLAGEGVSPLADVQRFSAQVVSAVSEAFNNVVTHGYSNRRDGKVLLGFSFTRGVLEVTMTDYGESFQIAAIPSPNLDALPESGLGVFIIKSFMDTVEYAAGPPNIMRMVKRIPGHA